MRSIKRTKRVAGSVSLLIASFAVLACGSTTGDLSSSGDGAEKPAPEGSDPAKPGKSSANSGGTSSAMGGTAARSSYAAGGASSSSTPAKGGAASGQASSADNPPTSGPHFTGSGTGFRPLIAGCGPETAIQCGGTCEKTGGSAGVSVIRPPATLCFSGEGDNTPNDPAVVIEQSIERLNGKEYIHIRVTFDPAFVDNTYGKGSCCGWPKQRGHWFRDLTSSDHTELLLTDGTGGTVMHFKVDFVSADPASPCGYGTLGVAGGDGSLLQGDPAHVLSVATSLDRNLNGCGHCKSAACAPSGDCTIDSPATDQQFTPNAATPTWDYRQVYEVWIDMAAFSGKGFGQANITYVHASPSKSTDTVIVTPSPCPPEWGTPYCPPGVIQEGGGCFETPDDGPGCPPNHQLYLTPEGTRVCTPIPFSNYPGMDPCPAGYALDLASEGQYCLPVR